MSNKPEHTTYFRELIRKLRELKISADSGEIITSSDNAEKLEFMQLPFPPEAFDRMSPDEKEALFISRIDAFNIENIIEFVSRNFNATILVENREINFPKKINSWTCDYIFSYLFC